MVTGWVRSGIAAGALLALLCGTPSSLVAQSRSEGATMRRLRLSLQDQALELLARDGTTFYALGAVVESDGTIEGFSPDHWPALEAPPAEWRDSLIVGFRGIERPVQAVAILIDLGRSGSPADSFASFLGETPSECQQFRIPLLGTATSSGASWGAPQPEQCEPLFGLATGSSSLSGPLSVEKLIHGKFVAYTLVWQVGVPGGDPIVFRADGSVMNAKAGLAGRWSIMDDSTLVIAGPGGALAGKPHIFRSRAGKLVSPPTAGTGSTGTWWIESVSGKR